MTDHSSDTPTYREPMREPTREPTAATSILPWLWLAVALAAYLHQFLPLVRPLLNLLGVRP